MDPLFLIKRQVGRGRERNDFGVIISGFTFLRLDAYYQEMIKGVIIVAAVVADVYRQRMRPRSR